MWYFCGINVFMMTLPVFVVVQKLAVAARPWLSRLASLTFGIYLCHFAVIPVCYDGAFLQSQRAGPRRGRPVLPIGRRFSPP